MVKFYSTSSLFHYTWDQVSKAFWQRYPNPYSKHVLSEDVVCREVRDGKLYSRRLLTKTNPLPAWGHFLIGGVRQICIMEESIVDPVARTLTTYSRNLGLARVLRLEEKCVYRHTMDKQTLCERHAWVNSPVIGLGAAVQKFAVDRYKKNTRKAQTGLTVVLDNLYANQLTQVISNKEKLRDKARKAKEIAQAKSRSILQTN